MSILHPVRLQDSKLLRYFSYKQFPGLAITAHTAFDSQQAKDQPIRAVNTANRDDRLVQAAAILPVVTGKQFPAMPPPGGRGRGGIA